MNFAPALLARLDFLARVVDKERQYLLDTDQRLFTSGMPDPEVARIAADPALAERVDAFVTRFGRLQDTVGDKLMPTLLHALSEQPRAAIDNLLKAEKLGWIDSADVWMEMRQLRNQMVHEYIEDLAILGSALRAGHGLTPVLALAAQQCCAEARRVLAMAG